MPEFIYPETQAAELSGLPLKKFAAARVKYLRQGVHWDIMQNDHVGYCEEGLLKVTEKITGKSSHDLLVQFAKKRAAVLPPALRQIFQATVTRIYPNPHLLQAKLKETGEVINVRCKTTKNFRIGMELPVRAPENFLESITTLKPIGATPTFDLARKLPRYGGRW